MSSVDLVILGFLKKKSMSAYDMTQTVKKSRLKKIIKIGSPTIYQNIKKLKTKEYLSSETVKEGEMPEKIVYSLTDKGEHYFLELMERFSSTPGRMFFDFNAFLKNLPSVDHDTGLRMLKNLKLFFYDMKEDLENDINDIKSPSFELRAILRQYYFLLKAMINWIEEVIHDYQNINNAS